MQTPEEVSIFFYEDKDVKYGLPILPQLFEKRVGPFLKQVFIRVLSVYIRKKTKQEKRIVKFAIKPEWVEAINTIRKA